MTSQTDATPKIAAPMLSLLLLTLLSPTPTTAFLPQSHSQQHTTTSTHTTCNQPLHMIAVGKNYQPKWKKKKTLAEETGEAAPPSAVGLTGTVPVLFKMGDETKTSMATVGQPLRDVASQAGQYIKYGCGKGECGTCECLSNGQWIRPCTAVVPADFDIDGSGQYVITVKEVKNKARSSGKFYSVRSFLMGFYNNILGMAGMVMTKRAAKRNYDERMGYEDMVKAKVMEKKRLAALEGGGGAKVVQRQLIEK